MADLNFQNPEVTVKLLRLPLLAADVGVKISG
jgi:hypothetical protein